MISTVTPKEVQFLKPLTKYWQSIFQMWKGDVHSEHLQHMQYMCILPMEDKVSETGQWHLQTAQPVLACVLNFITHNFSKTYCKVSRGQSFQEANCQNPWC